MAMVRDEASDPELSRILDRARGVADEAQADPDAALGG
jgi:hypothetical protein